MEELLSRGRGPVPGLQELLRGEGVVPSAISTGFTEVAVGPKGVCICPMDYSVQAVVLTREDIEMLYRETHPKTEA